MCKANSGEGLGIIDLCMVNLAFLHKLIWILLHVCGCGFDISMLDTSLIWIYLSPEIESMGLDRLMHGGRRLLFLVLILWCSHIPLLVHYLWLYSISTQHFGKVGNLGHLENATRV